MGLLGMILAALGFTRFLLLEGEGGGGGDGGESGQGDGGSGGGGGSGEEGQSSGEGDKQTPRRVEEMSEAELRSELIATRSEAKSYRLDKEANERRLRDVEAELDQRKKAEMSELDRAKAEKEEADRRAQEALEGLKNERLRNLVLEVAGARKALAPADVVVFVEKRSSEVRWNDSEPDRASVETIVGDILKDRPYLVNGQPATSPANAESGGTDLKDFDPRARMRSAYSGETNRR